MMPRTDFLIVGAGLAGIAAAETLRRLASRASITVVSGETDLPHDRPPLSKEFLRGERTRSEVLLHPYEYYAQERVTLLRGRPALELDIAAHLVTLADGEAISYRRLLLATGGRPRKLGVPGEGLTGVFELRTLAEAERIRDAAADAERVFVVGAGFIGVEVAASLTSRGLAVSVLNMDERLWPTVASDEVTTFIQRELELRGVRLHHGERVTEIEGKHHVEIVRTERGRHFADMVIVGAGIQLTTELALSAGLAVERGIVVDEYLQTSGVDVFAAGDVASFPDPFGGRRHVEHWDNAVTQGKVAAANMLGQRVPFRHVPYFWSDIFDLTVNVVGYLDASHPTILRGSVEDRAFSVLHMCDDALRGAVMVNRARERRAASELIRRQTPISAHIDRLRDPTFDLRALVNPR